MPRTWVLLVLFLATAIPAFANGPPCERSTKALAALSCDELDALFARGACTPLPCGYARGTILRFTAYYRCPRLAACVSGLTWKGKHFACDGSFVNQFAGFKALRSCARIETSWWDGQTCVVLDYPTGTPLFDDMRDEVRQIGTNLWLSRLYNRYTHAFRGYILLEPESRRCDRCR
jgi:hypothetical protein